MAVKHALTSGKGDGSDADLVRASNWNADHLADVFAPTGLTGATTPARFVGGTVSGAPITGTFAVNDFVIAQDGKVWLCTSAGSPGTWAQVGGAADIVQGQSGGGNFRIPVLGTSPDILPASPSAYDDEFGAALSGWSALGTLDVSEANVLPSHYHLQTAAAGAWLVYGIYKTIPTPPFTVTTHIRSCLLNANYQNYGLMLAEAVPGKLMLFGNMFWNGNDNSGYGLWTNRTSRASWSGDSFISPTGARAYFIRMIVTTLTNITLQTSVNGYIWRTIYTGVNPGFTAGNVGLFATPNDQSQKLEAYFDWIRFTLSSYMDAIPIMTSATDPSGIASASSHYGGCPVWWAFAPTAGWITDGTSTGWLQYQFPSAITAVGYSIRPWWVDNYPGRTPKTWEFWGSNDDFATHDVLDSQTDWASPNSTDSVYFPISSPGSYLSYRLNVTANNGDGYMGVGNFQIYVAR